MPFPSPEQTALLAELADGRSAIVISGPGTGKSRTALELARQRLPSLKTDNGHQVLFLSFSNAAINRLADSAGLRFGRQERRHMKFATFHSCAADILSHYGRFVGLPIGSRVIDKLDERLIAFEAGWTPADKNYRDNLLSLGPQGKLCFDVLLPMATKILETSPKLCEILGRCYPLIVVDEFQDTSAEQWHFLRSLGGASQVVVFGDPNQIIYSSLHAATEQRLIEFETWKAVPRSVLPAVNHRCDRIEILKFAEAIISGSPYSPVKGGDVQFLPLRFRDQLRASLAVIWKRIQEKFGDAETVGVLAPSNKLVEEIATGLRNPPAGSQVKFPVFISMARDEAAYDSAILALAALRDLAVDSSAHKLRRAAIALSAMNAMWNTRRLPKTKDVSVLEDAISKGISNNAGWGQFFEALRTSRALANELPAMVQLLIGIPDLKSACGRLAAHFEIARRKCPNVPVQISLFDEMLSNREPKGLHGYEASGAKTHAITYPKAKGREFDIVVLVVDPRHESSKAPLDERRRLYYVCVTRAKKLLLVIHYNNDLGPVLGPVLKPL